MSKITRLVSLALFFVLVLTACNLPSAADQAEATAGADAVLTAAAQTVEANMTQGAILNPPTIPPTSTGGIPTSTLAVATTSAPPTNPPPTQTCDVAQFVDDVTIPDGTTLQPNEAFTKTWRFKNVGTCSWTPSYAIIFSNGDAMNGPATQALTGNVNPGQTLDISVNLTAPAADGTYKGFWKLRNAAGVHFSQFYVEIKVKTPSPTAGPTTVTLNSTMGGTVYNPASNIPVTILAGDTGSNDLARGFMSFDISAMSGATINSAALDLTGCSVVHDPFGNLSGIWVGEVQFGPTLDQADYNVSGAGIQLLNAIPGSTIDVKSYVQTRASASEPRFQIRLHPSAGNSNNDNQADYMTCGAPKLTVTYQP